jgi:hypothetical protein
MAIAKAFIARKITINLPKDDVITIEIETDEEIHEYKTSNIVYGED